VGRWGSARDEDYPWHAVDPLAAGKKRTLCGRLVKDAPSTEVRELVGCVQCLSVERRRERRPRREDQR
jgi:hypothetical protein